MEQPDPKHYNDFLQNSVQILDTLVLSIELPPEIVAAINRQTEQYYEIQEFKYRVEREAQELRRKQIEANGIAAFQTHRQPGNFGLVSALARYRGDAGAGPVAECKNRDYRQRQRRPADHSRQRRQSPVAGPGAEARRRRVNAEQQDVGRLSPRQRAGADINGAGRNAGRRCAEQPPAAGATKTPEAPPDGSVATSQPLSTYLDLSRIKALLPWLTEELGSTKSATSSGAGAAKQITRKRNVAETSRHSVQTSRSTPRNHRRRSLWAGNAAAPWCSLISLAIGLGGYALGLKLAHRDIAATTQLIQQLHDRKSEAQTSRSPTRPPAYAALQAKFASVQIGDGRDETSAKHL